MQQKVQVRAGQEVKLTTFTCGEQNRTAWLYYVIISQVTICSIHNVISLSLCLPLSGQSLYSMLARFQLGFVMACPKNSYPRFLSSALSQHTPPILPLEIDDHGVIIQLGCISDRLSD